MKILIGGIVGGVVLFIWGFVSHVVLPLGEIGFNTIPDDKLLISVMQNSVRESGLYVFPGYDMSRKMTPEEMKTWEEKYKAGPTGLLVYRSEGGEVMSPKQLFTQFVSVLLAALVAAFLLSLTAASFRKQVIFVTLLGLFSWLTISVPYWNWYGFPADFTTAGLIDGVVGWFLAGLAMAAVMKKSNS